VPEKRPGMWTITR